MNKLQLVGSLASATVITIALVVLAAANIPQPYRSAQAANSAVPSGSVTIIPTVLSAASSEAVMSSTDSDETTDIASAASDTAASDGPVPASLAAMFPGSAISSMAAWNAPAGDCKYQINEKEAGTCGGVILLRFADGSVSYIVGIEGATVAFVGSHKTSDESTNTNYLSINKFVIKGKSILRTAMDESTNQCVSALSSDNVLTLSCKVTNSNNGMVVGFTMTKGTREFDTLGRNYDSTN